MTEEKRKGTPERMAPGRLGLWMMRGEGAQPSNTVLPVTARPALWPLVMAQPKREPVA